MAPTVSLPAVAAEFVAMTLFVVIGCGSAMGMATQEGWLLQVALTFGFAITSLAYAVGHFSGGHINCAVTLGLVLTGHCSVQQGTANFAAQMAGSLAGAMLLCLVYPPEKDRTGSLASNSLSEQFHWNNAVLGEVMMTFLLVFVVLQTACHPQSASNRPQACVAIGFAVFLAHAVLIPIDGCSINPTRSFGPAVVAQIRYPGSKSLDGMWIFWSGPLIGAALAAAVYEGFRCGFPSAFEEPSGESAAEDKVANEDKGHGIGDLGLDDITIGIADGTEKEPLSPKSQAKAKAKAGAEDDNLGAETDEGNGACCVFLRSCTPLAALGLPNTGRRV